VATIRVTHSIGDLASDMAKIPPRAVKDLSGIVRSNTKAGEKLGRAFAKSGAGPHGKNYYKRFGWEMLGPLTGEYGPHGDVLNNAVGAGWRNGPPNTDLERSLDIIGPKFRADVQDAPGAWFWT
jgi:hypothetical protein